MKPGMTCPVRACSVGRSGIASWAEAVEVFVSPVAVRMVVGVAVWSICRRGAVGME